MNSEELLNVVIKNYEQPLRKYFYNRLRRSDEIDDFIQDLYLRVFSYKNPNKIESIERFTFTIALNLVRDYSRRSAQKIRSNSIPLEDLDILVSCMDPQRIIQAKEILKLLSNAFNHSERLKVIFIEKYIKGLSQADIANRLGISVSAVEKHGMKINKTLSEINHNLTNE